jgi:hypothetical protein
VLSHFIDTFTPPGNSAEPARPLFERRASFMPGAVDAFSPSSGPCWFGPCPFVQRKNHATAGGASCFVELVPAHRGPGGEGRLPTGLCRSFPCPMAGLRVSILLVTHPLRESHARHFGSAFLNEPPPARKTSRRFKTGMVLACHSLYGWIASFRSLSRPERIV